MKIISKCVGVCALAIAANCVLDDGVKTIAVEPNDLGVATLQTTRVLDHGNSVYTLHAYSATDQELASVRLTIGTIPDLPQIFPGDATGSEIVVAVAGNRDTRIVSHETQLFVIHPTPSTAAAQLLALKTVSSTLAREANIITDSEAAAAVEDPSIIIGGNTTVTCQVGYVMKTPVADQCCYTTNAQQHYTIFVRPTDSEVITRNQNPHLTGCKAMDGVSACSGSACYFGPLGFAKPSMLDEGTSPIIQSTGSIPSCNASGTAPAKFGNVTGTAASNQGCPGANEGSGFWDY